MGLAQAIEYLTTLSEGVDPATGEVLPEGHICNRDDIAEALHTVLLVARKKKRQLPPNAGQPWTPEEDQRLLGEYRADQTISHLAAAHGRTRGAIQSRLKLLGATIPQQGNNG